MHALLDEAVRRADHAEVYTLERTTLPVKFDTQGLSTIKTRQTAGAAVRVIHQGRLGYATTTDLEHPADVVNAAVETAAFGDPSAFEFPGETPAGLPGLFEPSVQALSADRLVDLGAAIQTAVAAAGDDIDVEVSIQSVIDRVRIANSNGLDAEETTSQLVIGIEAGRTRDDDIYLVGDHVIVGDPATVTADAVTRRVTRLLELGKTLVPAPHGRLPIVFTPSGALAILLPLMIGLSGKAAFLGMSPLADKLGTAICDPRFTLSDDGQARGGARTASFDDEGTASCKTPLIERGELSGFYYDVRTGQLAGVPSTGNGYKGSLIGERNFRPATGASLSHVVVESGDTSQEDLIRGIQRGLLVDSVLGLGQGNLYAGDFSNNVSAAFLIEDGRIVGRVKNAMIAGNSYELLREHLLGVGDDAAWVYGRVRTPSIVLGDVKIASKG